MMLPGLYYLQNIGGGYNGTHIYLPCRTCLHGLPMALCFPHQGKGKISGVGYMKGIGVGLMALYMVSICSYALS
jgi:hypothetical protein